MAAFDKITSGIDSIDQVLDYIRLGDNVVWQVSSIDEYRYFAESFAQAVTEAGKELIYMRFAKHEPLVKQGEYVKIYQLDSNQGFEAFTVAVHDIITEKGREALYIFDSLSELQVAWASDLMMGNFFCVTCPYLFELDTVAYFPIIRSRHSFDAVARIRDTTQLFLNIYNDKEDWYFQPLKVWNRYSSTMFRPHHSKKEEQDFQPITDGVGSSKFYKVVDEEEGFLQDQNLDNWERFFSKAKMEYQQGTLSEKTCGDMCRIMMSRDQNMAALVEKHFKPKDYFLVKDRLIGSGTIGGKACGMLLARNLVKYYLPESRELMEPHDSFYIGSDVFYTYIVENQCWKLRIRQRTEEGYFEAGKELKEKLLHGEFPGKTKEQFMHLLDYFGQAPIIARSSSLQEDGFGNAFAGKYESVFCVNSGTMEERLKDFEDAIRTVYASTMDESALEYRRRRGLGQRDEQMAILVQRVSGSLYDQYFMPGAAGVGYSYSAYRWREDMDPEAGMLRLVMGLGTRAVDRTEGDYPRIVSLDCPESTTITDIAKKHRFSQHQVDLLNTSTNQLETKELKDVMLHMPRWYQNIVLEHDYDAEMLLRNRGDRREVLFASCQNLAARREFTDFMKNILRVLEEQYQYPVDIEFAVNFSQDRNFVVNLLQCRPLQTGSRNKEVDLPEIPKKNLFFSLQDASMGSSMCTEIDFVIIVDPKEYYECPYKDKAQVAIMIGKINRWFQQKDKKILLMVPGRIGTSSPELGIPVAFSDISEMTAICEVAYSQAGYQPELSYGSHMFQDLVESEILYSAIFESSKTKEYQPELFQDKRNILEQIVPRSNGWEDMIQVYQVEKDPMILAFDMIKGKTICGFKII